MRSFTLREFSERFRTCTATSHQRARKMFFLSFYRVISVREKVNAQIFRKQDKTLNGVQSLGTNRMSERWSRRHQSGLASCLSLHSCGCQRATPPHRQAAVGWLDSGRCRRGATRHCTSPDPRSRLWERTNDQFTQIIRKLFCSMLDTFCSVCDYHLCDILCCRNV